jgi:asparagine synthase (glutamine-hydrolysing)
VNDLLSENAISKSGIFDYKRVGGLVRKCRRSRGVLLSERENMAIVGIVSTQLVDHHFIQNFPAYPINEPKNLKTFR